MKKRYIYVPLIIILTVSIIYITKNNSKTFNIDGINYAVTVNGKEDNKFPAKGPYKVELSCEGGKGFWNYEEWVVEIYNVEEGNVYCNLSFTNENATKLNDYIIDLLNGSTSVSASTKTPSDGSTLEKITEHGEEDYRYRGIDPNNYIKFNNELWRIIGVFDDNTHSITNNHLVKIIRNNSIGSYIWINPNQMFATLMRSDYSNSLMHKMLNNSYYNHLDATEEGDCCEIYQYTKGKCDFTKIGIQDEYKNMIEDNVNWFLGGARSTHFTSTDMYVHERGENVESNHNISTYAAGITTPIGLIYASDYGYASPINCTTQLSKYYNDGCSNKNWLNNGDSYWFITHESKENTVSNSLFYISKYANVQADSIHFDHDVRPTLYLKSDVYYLSGTGTQTDPYIIGI